MKQSLFSIILIIIFSSFSLRSLTKNDKSQVVELAYNIRDDVAKKQSKKYNMIVQSEGIEVPNDVLNLLSLGFQIQGPLSKDELQRILIDCVSEFLCLVNSNEKIRPYLKNYPFTPQNIRVSLFVNDPGGGEVSPPHISIASASRNVLYFRIKDFSEPYNYVTEEEPYKDALKLLGHKPNCLQ